MDVVTRIVSAFIFCTAMVVASVIIITNAPVSPYPHEKKKS